MSLIIELISSELAPASRNTLSPGETLTVGRSPAARISFPEDPYLSSLHCSIEAGSDTVLVRDLNSSNGTFVDGLRVQEAVVTAGQLICAGSLTMFPFLAGDAGEASRVHFLLRYFAFVDAPLFCLLDAARGPEVHNLIREAKERCQCLFEGKSAKELEAYAPYLIQLPRGAELLKALLVRGWDKGWASYFTSGSTFEQLRHHFRKFLFVNRDGNVNGSGEAYFRFYDPRVLRIFLPTCNSAEVVEFFGPVDTWILESNLPAQFVSLSQQHGVLSISRISGQLVT